MFNKLNKTQTTKSNQDNNTQPRWKCQQGDRNYKKLQNKNPGAKKYNN